jgi:hypothetical protein
MQETKTCPQVIAINPGWRYLAIAIFDEYELSEWRLKNLAGKGAKRKLEKVMSILAGFIERYSLNTLVIKKLHPARSSANLKNMTARIEAYCRKKGMAVSSYPIKELERRILDDSRINKKELIKVMTAEYPELTQELNREARNRHPYFIRLFEAVALGHICLREIENKH